MFLIEKTSFDVRVLGKTDGFQLQNDLTRWFYNDLMNDVEAVLLRYDRQDHVIQIPLININIDLDTFDNLLENLKIEILAHIEAKLKSIAISAEANWYLKQEISQNISRGKIEKSYFNIWLYFLENGHLPSTALPVDDEKMLVAIAETLSADEFSERKLMHLILNNSTALQRLILQHDEIFLSTILGIFVRRDIKSITEWRKFLETTFTNIDISQWTNEADRLFIKSLTKSYTKVHFWAFVLERFSNPLLDGSHIMDTLDMVIHIMKISAEKMRRTGSIESKAFSLSAFCQQILDKNIFKSYTSKKLRIEKSIKKLIKENSNSETKKFDNYNNPNEFLELEDKSATKKNKLNGDLSIKQTKSKDSVPLKDVYYIKNAGVVICHSFLLSFFNNLGLVGENQKFKDEAALHKAIQMIEHLATGDTSIPEYRLILGKILCGLPLEIPLDRDIIIHANDQKEAINLLEAIMQHWSILGTTNIEALRQGFFFRDGKLSHSDKGWLLQVEQRTEDILLSRLPWGIGMIKLPFMKEILTVEWA